MSCLTIEQPEPTPCESTQEQSVVLSADAVRHSLMSLQNYVKKHNYEGHDLFDGLNSTLFKQSPFYRNEFL